MKYTHSELKERFDSDLVFSIKVNTDTLKLNHKDLNFLEFVNILSLIYGQNEEINNHIDSTLLGYGGSNVINTSAYRKRIKGEEIHLCPRRSESPFSPSDMDSWDKIGEDRVCSYCGSLHPEDLNKLIKKQEVEVARFGPMPPTATRAFSSTAGNCRPMTWWVSLAWSATSRPGGISSMRWATQAPRAGRRS